MGITFESSHPPAEVYTVCISVISVCILRHVVRYSIVGLNIVLILEIHVIRSTRLSLRLYHFPQVLIRSIRGGTMGFSPIYLVVRAVSILLVVRIRLHEGL